MQDLVLSTAFLGGFHRGPAQGAKIPLENPPFNPYKNPPRLGNVQNSYFLLIKTHLGDFGGPPFLTPTKIPLSPPMKF